MLDSNILDEKIASLKELSRLAENRSKIYGFFSFFYIQPPSRDFLKRLFDNSFLSSLACMKTREVFPSDLTDGIRTIEDFVRKYESSCGLDPSLEDSLSIEYTRLFRGVKRSYSLPPPYESVYAEGDLTWGESTSKVLEEYRKSGLDLQDKYRGEPPDHISFELDFMRFLCSKEAEAWKNKDQKGALRHLKLEKKFLEEHLARWVYTFLEKVVELDRLGFYRGLTKMTGGFIKFDYDQIDAYIRMGEHDRVDFQG